MSLRAQFSPPKQQPVVLRTRVSATPHRTVVRGRQGYSCSARGAPPGKVRQPPDVLSGPPRNHPPSTTAQHRSISAGEQNLLVRFGIDSVVGRVVARMLVLLIFFQPVYVAMGMELDGEAEQPADLSAEETQEPEESAPVLEEVEPDESDVEPEADQAEDGVTDSESEALSEQDAVGGGETSDVEGDVQEEIVTPVDEEPVDPVSDGEPTQEADADAAQDSAEEAGEEVVDSEGAEEASGSGDGVVSDSGSIDEPADGAGEDAEEEVTGTGSTETDEGVAADEAGDGAGADEGADTSGGSSGGGGGGVSDADADDTEDAEDTETGETSESSSDTASTTDEHAEDGTASEEHASTTDNGAADTGGGDGSTHASTTEPSLDDMAESVSVATSTEEYVEGNGSTTPVTIAAQNMTNKYTFGEGDCTVVADGEFYCVADSPQMHMTGDPRVYAEKDREGDREIYYFDGVEIKRVTNNAYDDFAPVFEEKTKRIVWQAMINDRLQVMLYEIPTNTTRQVTTSRQNSSNPHIAGDTVVWQEWIDTNWEVMMTDVDNNGAAFVLERLTDNMVHDMFPRAYDDLITWQSEKGASWEVIVYDLRTGQQHALEKDEATKYENPRFVLLFDSRHDNGDVETIGYDLDTGEMMELGTKAKPIPAEPITPRDETPEAIPREATSTPQIKVGREGDGSNDDVIL